MSEDEIEFEYDDDDDLMSGLSLESDDDQQVLELTSTSADNNGLEKDNFLQSKAFKYKCWKMNDFVEQYFLNPVEKLSASQLPNCTFDDLLIMLQYKRWQCDEVILDFFEDPRKLYTNSGLPYPDAPNNTLERVCNFSCDICCETYDTVDVYSLSCKHKFCINCYDLYIDNQVHSGTLISCIDVSCSLVIPHKDIEKILRLLEKNHDWIKMIRPMSENPLLIETAKVLIDGKKNFTWCPALDCENFTELIDGQFDDPEAEPQHLESVPIVRCAASHEFCFNCKYENHLPCPCWIVRKWIKKCNDDSETANWIDANTHSCPKCASAIEKNGGCNHMVCSNCGQEFCWICLQGWSKHKNFYNCNAFKEPDPEISKVKNKKRLSLQRYLHYYKRFSVHESSTKGDLKNIEKIENLAKEYMELRRLSDQMDLSWSDIQFLSDSIRCLTNGRKTLKWTYCFAYYLEDSNFGHIFEDNQNYLNQSVEELSEVFEKITSKKSKVNIVQTLLNYRKDILNLSNLITSRQRALIDGCNENLINELLKFTT